VCGPCQLPQQTGVDDRLVLLVERLGQGEEVGLLGRVELIDVVDEDAGRGDQRQERLGHLHVGQGGLQIGDVALEEGAALVGVGDRAGGHQLAGEGSRGDLAGPRQVVVVGGEAALALGAQERHRRARHVA